MYLLIYYYYKCFLFFFKTQLSVTVSLYIQNLKHNVYLKQFCFAFITLVLSFFSYKYYKYIYMLYTILAVNYIYLFLKLLFGVRLLKKTTIYYFSLKL